MEYPLEIQEGNVEKFIYELNDDPIEALAQDMARVVDEYQSQWNIYRNNKIQDVDLTLNAYEELRSANPHLALSMIAWFLAERTVSMDNRRRKGVKGSIIALVDSQKLGAEYFEDKPNVKIIYERSQKLF